MLFIFVRRGEAIFLYPWAFIIFREAALVWIFVEMLMYIVILLAGYIYISGRKGALDWASTPQVAHLVTLSMAEPEGGYNKIPFTQRLAAASGNAQSVAEGAGISRAERHAFVVAALGILRRGVAECFCHGEA